MAEQQQPRYFDIEDYETGKKYRVEAFDAEATYDEAVEYLSTLPEEDLPQYEYSTNEEPIAAPVAPQASASMQNLEEPVAPAPVPSNNIQTTTKLGGDRLGEYENYEVDPFSSADEQEYLRLSRDPNVSFEELESWVRSKGGYLRGREEFDAYRQAIAEGREVGSAIEYKPLGSELLGEYAPEVDPTIDSDLEAAIEKGMAYNPMGLAARALQDLFDMEQGGVSKDAIRQQYPDLTDDQIEEIHDRLIGELRRRELINANFQVDARDVNPVLDFFGDVVGGASPVDLIPLGRGATVGRRLAESAAANFAVDAAMQGGDIAYGAQQRYDPMQGAIAAAAGTALQGGFEVVGAGLNRVFRTAPGTPAPATTGAPIVVPTARKGSKAYTGQIGEVQKQISAQVNELTKGWTNLPEVEVFENFKGVGKLDNKSLAVYSTKTLEDGATVPVIRINSEALLATAAKRKVSPESLVEAATFHEALGHHGLLSVFDKDLDAFLDDIYVNGEASFRNQVDNWLEKNTKAYANFSPVKRRILATEELLAEASEKGPIARRKLDSLANYLKNFARTRMGMNLKYSQREIRSYLAVAHERTMKGQRSFSGTDVTKNIYIGRQGAERLALRPGRTYKDVSEAYNNKEDYLLEDKDFGPDGVVRENTGWYRGKDNKWRYEITDNEASADFSVLEKESQYNPAYEQDLSSVLLHPTLFKAYPEFRRYKVTFDSEEASPNTLGTYITGENKIFINPRLNGQQKLSVLLHEVQHAVQHKEAFAFGGDPESAMFSLPDSTVLKGSKNLLQHFKVEAEDAVEIYGVVSSVLERDLAQSARKMNADRQYFYEREITAPESLEDSYYDAYTELENSLADEFDLDGPKLEKVMDAIVDPSMEEVVVAQANDSVDRYEELANAVRSKNFDEMRQIALGDNLASYEAYKHLLGEYEARDVQARQSLTEEERKRTPALSSEPGIDPDSLTSVDIYGRAMSDEFYGGSDKTYSSGSKRPSTSDRSRVEARKQFWRNKENPDWNPDDPNGLPTDKYMMGDEGRIEDQDFDGRMTMILRELQDEYVPTQRSQAEAQRAARIAGLRSRQYKSQKGLEDLDIRLFQYEAVNERYQARLLRITDRMAQAKEAEDINGYVRASDEFKRVLYEYKALAAKIQNDQAQIGRALNAMKALTLTKRNIADTLGLMGGNKADADAFAALDDPATLDALAKMMSEQIQAGNTLGAAKLAEKVGKPYWWQYGLSYLHLSMLSGLGTHAVNAYDAVNVLGRKLEERMVGAAVGTTRRAFGAKDTMSAMEGLGFTYGVLRALVDADTYKNAYRAFKEGYEFQPFDARIERQDARIPYLSKINDALYASDMFWRSFHMSANMYSLGLRKAYKDGFRGKELFDETYANVVNADKELFDEAKRHADEALLVDTPSAFTSWLEAGKNIKPNMTAGQQARAFTLNLMFPFLRVSDRLIFQALKRVPLVAFVDHNTRREWGMGGAARDAVIARQLMGGALISYYWMMADPENQDQEGYIEGYGPENYEERMGLEATGYRPETVVEEDQVMRNANQINITANPFNTRNNVAVLVASIRQQWEQSKKTDADANEVALLMASAMRASGTFLMKQGYAGNVLPYAEALEAGPQQEGVVAGLAGDLASRAVPAAVRQFNQMYFDPIKRDTTGDKSVGDRILGRVQSGIPGLSDLMPANLTALGEEQDQGRTLLRLGDGTEIKQGDPYTELRRLERETEKPLLTEFSGTFTYEGESIKLTAHEKNKWQAIQGQYLRDVMLEWITSEDWKQMSDEEKIDVVKDIKEEAYEDAKDQLLDEILTARGK